MFQREKVRAFEFLLDHPWVPVTLGLLVAFLLAVDIHNDLTTGSSSRHILSELLLGCLVAIAGFYVWRQFGIAVRTESRLRQKLEIAETQRSKWQAQQRDLLHQFSQAIISEFDGWGLSSTEHEVAFLLLKGLSMKEIATLRESTPHSVRQQAHTIYQKSGLGSRSELAAHFLGGLLPSRADLPKKENTA